MNATFKVVFNKARGALMVANEVTSCVQSKGTKTVLASAFAMALIGLSDGASATIAGIDIVGGSVQGYSVIWDSETLPGNTIKITLNKALEDEIQQAAPLKTVESYGLMIQDGAAGALDNADIVSTTMFPVDSADQSINVALGINGGNVTLKGATTHISATSSLAGAGNSWVAALLVEGGVLNLAADKTEIRATSSNKTGKVAYGMKASVGSLMSNGDLNVTASSQDKDAYALYADQHSTVHLSGNTTLTAQTGAPNAHAYAVYLDSTASLTLGGQQNILNGDVFVYGPVAGFLRLNGNTVINGNLAGGGYILNNGSLTISGALDGFSGVFEMDAGNLSLTNENGYFGERAHVSVRGGTLDVLNTNVTDFGNTYISEGATLLTNGQRAFGVAADAGTSDLNRLAFQYKGVRFEDGTLAINDEKSSLEWVKKAAGLLYPNAPYSLGSPQLLLMGRLVDANGAEIKTIKSSDIVEHTIMPWVHCDATEETGNGVILRWDKNVGVQSIALNKNLPILELANNLTLVGSENGGELLSTDGSLREFWVVNANGSSFVDQYVLTLGNTNVSNTTGSISDKVRVYISQYGKINVVAGSFNIGHLTLASNDDYLLNVSGNLHVNQLDNRGPLVHRYAQITIGHNDVGNNGTGNMTVDSFEVQGTAVGISSNWTDDIEQTLDKMAKMAIKRFKNNTVESSFGVNSGGLLSLGNSTTDAAESLLMKSGVTLGMDSGKTNGALYIDASNGPLTLKSGIGIRATSAHDNTLSVGSGGILLIDATKVKSSVFGDNTTVIFEEGADAYVDNITKDGLLLTGKNSTITLNDLALRTNDHMIRLGTVKLDPLTQGCRLEVNVVDTKEKAGITDQGVFEAIHSVYEAGRNDTNATHQADAFAARVGQGEKYFGSMQAANRAATEMRALATMAGVQSTSWDSASLFNDRIQARQSLANLGAKGTGLWADLYASRNKSESFGGGAGYEADIHGGIFGADTTLQNGLTVGAALTYAKADTDTTGTLTKISNKSEFVGVSVYGSMPLDRANIMADVTYLYGDHDVKANAGGSWGDTVKTNLFAGGVRAEWLSTYAGVNVMPHVGLRFTTLETGAYEAAFDTEKSRQNIVTLPVGVTLSADLTAGDWAIKPIADFSVVPAIGDRDVDVAFGAQQKLAVNVIESGLFNATLGLAAQEGAWTIGVNYQLGVGANKRANNSLNANMSYAF